MGHSGPCVVVDSGHVAGKPKREVKAINFSVNVTEEK